MSNSLKHFGIKLAYEQLEKKGNKLEVFKNLIDWSHLQTIIYRRGNRGRPAYNPIMMFKVLVLQHLYGISDEEIEYQIIDRISFQDFLGFPENIPDHSTIWRFREYLSENNLHDALWDELDRQIKDKNIQYSKGVIQDASFVTANPGKTNSSDKIDRGRGQPTTRNEDGSWSQKNGKNYFGYKLHAKMEIENYFITELAVTTASVSDGTIDLAEPDEIVYRDRGYSNHKTKAKGDATMKKRVRGQEKLLPKDLLRNKRISKIRVVGERPFAVIKTILHGGHTLYTELHRVFTQQFMNCFVYNLIQLKRVI